MLIGAGDVLKVAGGVAAALGAKKIYDHFYGESEDLDEEMAEVYLAKGPGGLRRWLTREEHAEDKDEAYEMVADFEDENEDVVKKYARRKARRDDRAAKREADEEARKSRRGGRASATA